MNQSIVIKANNFGIMVLLDPKADFATLKHMVAEKFSESRKFLGDATMALSFEGRELTEDESRELLDVIGACSDLRVACLIDKDPEREELFKKSLSDRLMELDSKTGQFYKGNLRSGQLLEFETSVVVLGNVNPGAKIVSKGNIIIIGSLMGNAVAGVAGNENAFVLALQMNPMQIRIADTIARSPDEPDIGADDGPQIAFLVDGNIHIEPLDKDIMKNINF